MSQAITTSGGAARCMTLQGKISIVIPCYNHGAMLLETLASIEQVRIDSLAEVIIVNDGSTDPETRRIFAELDRQKYNIIDQENRGLGGARNAGVAMARGEFILPVDSDNRIRRAYLDQGLAILMKDAEVGVVYGDRELFGERTGRSRVADFDWKSMVIDNQIDACALYRKSVWESVGGYDEKMPRMGFEDWDFWMRVALRGWKFFHLNEIAYDYRVRTGSMISDTLQYRYELVDHIFNKPGFDLPRALREEIKAREQVAVISNSLPYRMLSSFVAPLRSMKKLQVKMRRSR